MQWKLIRTKVGFTDDPDFCLAQGTYPDEEIYSYTGPRPNLSAAFYCEFYNAAGTNLASRGTYAFTVFERATWGDPALQQWHDIDGLSGNDVEAFRRVVVENLSLDTVRFGVRLTNITPPDGAVGIRVYAVAYV